MLTCLPLETNLNPNQAEGVAIRFPDRRNDHEVEFVIVIGKKGSRIKKEDALDYIAGYTLGLDMTVRGVEDRSFRPRRVRRR